MDRKNDLCRSVVHVLIDWSPLVNRPEVSRDRFFRQDRRLADQLPDTVTNPMAILLRNPLFNPNFNRLPGAQFIVGTQAHKTEAVWLLAHTLNRSVKSQVEELQRMFERKAN